MLEIIIIIFIFCLNINSAKLNERDLHTSFFVVIKQQQKQQQK